MVPPCGVQALTIDHSITNAAAQKFVKRKRPETIRARVEIMNLEGQACCLARQTYTTDRPNFRSTSLNELHWASWVGYTRQSKKKWEGKDHIGESQQNKTNNKMNIKGAVGLWDGMG